MQYPCEYFKHPIKYQLTWRSKAARENWAVWWVWVPQWLCLITVVFGSWKKLV